MRRDDEEMLAIGACAAVILAGCAMFGWKAKPAMIETPGWTAAETPISTGPARARVVAPPSTAFDDAIDYYYDLGPSEIDVSKYPAQQQYNYKVFKTSCGGCHPLARSISSPTESRTYWRWHLFVMKLHMRIGGSFVLDPVETKAVLDFLDYDSKVRKVQDRRGFDELTEQLKRRYDAVLEKRMRALQSGKQPQILH